MRAALSRALVALALVLAHGWAGAGASEDEPRRIVVKLRAATASRLAPALSSVDAGRSAAPAGLRSFLGRYRARTIRPALPARTAAIRHSQTGEARYTETVRERFRARTRRAHDPRTPDLGSIYVLNLEPGVDTAEVLAAIDADGIAEYAEEDKPVRVALTPDDPYLGSTGSWGQSYGDLWGLHKIGAPAAWDTATGNGVVVAVVDTGLDVAHPDIAANVWVNADETPGNGIDDDANGYVDDVNGWDFIGSSYRTPAPDSVPEDPNGHGTHVAGTVAATGGNGQGVVGVAWNARVMVPKGLDRSGTGWSSILADAIVYAADNGADVINNSWGGPGDSPFVRDAVAYAHGMGAVVVAAAGNDNEDAAGYYPPRCPQVLVVASTDSTDYRSSFSNWGSRVDVAAPGRDILSLRAAGTTMGTPLNSLYTRADGTSMAAPHVSGLAALVLSAHPEYTNEQVRQTLRASATDRGASGYDLDYGYGRVNATAAVAYAAPLEAKILAPVDSLRIAGAIEVWGTAQGLGFVRYTLEWGSGATPTSWTLLADSAAPVASGLLGTFDPASLSDGAYTLRLQAYDASARVFTDRVQVVVDYVSITSPAPPLTPSVAEVRKPGVPLPIVGTATGPTFQSFLVEWARGINPTTGWASSGMDLAGGGSAPVIAGTLATWDTADVPQADYYTVRVRVQNDGFVSESRTIVYLEPDLLNEAWPRWFEGGSDGHSGVVPAVDGDGNTWLSVGGPAWLSVPQRRFRAFRADGGAEFTSLMDFATSFLQHAAGDVDGLPGEEFVVNDAQTLRICRTDGSFTRLNAEVWRNFQYSPTVLADLDGDGRSEILAAGRNQAWNEVAIYAWRPDGQIVAGFPVVLAELNGNVPYSVPSLLVADFDRDGRPDILTIESTGSTSYTLRLFSPEGAPLPQPLPTLGGYPREMMLVDFERDGSPEIVVTGVEGGSTWVTHVISATGQERPGWPLSGRTAVAIADFDGDRLPEVVVKGEGGISIRRADGSLFSPAWPHVEDGYPVYGRPSVADVTGDGVPEVLVTRTVRLDSPSPLVASADERDAGPAADLQAAPPVRRSLDEEGLASQSAESGVNVVTWRSSYYLQLVALDRNNVEVRRWNLLGMNGEEVYGFYDAVTAGDFDADGQLDLAVTYPTSDNGGLHGGVLTVLKTGAPVRPSDWPMINHDPQNTGALVVPDTGPPTVSLVAPAPGATVAGTYTVVADAADDGWVAGVQFLLDGQPLGPESVWPPFQVPWDTGASTPGAHQLSAVVRDGAGRTATAAPVDVVVSQSSSPTVVITSPTEGQQVSGSVDVQVTVGDDHAVRSVELHVDGVRRATSAIAPFTLRWLSWQEADGAHVLVAKAIDDYGNTTPSIPVSVVLQNAGAWDSTFKTPLCATVSSVCDTGSLVDGRGTLGPEPNAPNTIGGTCPDTTGGTYHGDMGESADRIRVFTADGGRFAPGRTVTVETTVWGTVFYKSDSLQIFHAPDARAPQWTLVAQLKPPARGKQVLSTSFQLPPGDLQGFRAQYGPSSTGGPACRTSSGYTDHDDVVFHVGTNTAPVAVPGGPYSGLRQKPLVFDGTGSSDADGDTLGYTWDFGDGTQGTGPSPTHVYASTGTFTVTLTVSDGVTLSEAATTTATIESPPNVEPVAHAGGPYAAVRQQSVMFDGTGSTDADGDPLTYAWDFGDGTSGIGPTPSHAYASIGTFTVTLVVSDGQGGSSTATTTASITNRAPLAYAGADQTVELGVSVTLVGAGSDPDGDPVALEWRDALGSLVGTTPAVTLTLPLGVHDFTLTVADGFGGSATDSVRVTMQDTTPPVVTVVQPSGAPLVTGVPAVVQWTAQDNGALAGFDIHYSTNGGASFSAMPGCTGLPAAASSCTWTSPGPATAQGRVRVVARDASANAGQGESAFTIVDPIVVTNPNATVTWGVGSRRTITWTTNVDPAGTVKVELSRDGGATWSVLAASAPNIGSFNWVAAGATTSAARVRVSSNSVPAAADTSNVNFTIAAAAITVTTPNTSVRWAPGSSQTIRWNHNLGVQEAVKVELSRDSGSTWSVISASIANNAETTGSLVWTVTSPNTNKARIRVSWTTNSAVNDRSDVNFSIR